MADVINIIQEPANSVSPTVKIVQPFVVKQQNYYSTWGFNLINGTDQTVYQKNSGNEIYTSGSSVVLGAGNSAYGTNIIVIGDNNECLHSGVRQFGDFLTSTGSERMYYGVYNSTDNSTGILTYANTIIGAGRSYSTQFNALVAGVDNNDVPFVEIGKVSAKVTVPVNDGWLTPTLSMRDIKDAFVVRGQNAGYYLYGRSVNNGVGYENHYPLASNAAADNVAVRDGAGRIKVHVAYDGYDDYSELSPAHIADNNDSLLVPNMAYLENRYVQRDKTETYPLVVYGQSYNNGSYLDIVKELSVNANNGSIPLRNTRGEIIVPNTTYSDAAINYGQMTSYVATQIASAVASVYRYKGSVATYADLPNNLTEAEAGWVYDVQSSGDNYSWTGTDWDPLGGTGLVVSVNGKQGVVNLNSTDIGFQYQTMPTATSGLLGQIVQFIGTTDSTYTNGHFYKCIETSGVYSWQEIEFGSNITIVQTTGQSTSDVMSQKAVTDELAKKQDIIQYSTVPTASASLVGKIIQYTGTTDSTYTNGHFYKCAENSGSYSWIEVVFGGTDPSSLTGTTIPTTSTAASFVGQTYYNSTNGRVYQCVDINNGTYNWREVLLNDVTDFSGLAASSIGIHGTVNRSNQVAILGAAGYNGQEIAIGKDSYASGYSAVALGASANVSGAGAIQLGYGTNNAAYTFSVGIWNKGNYRMLEADGTIPPERITSANWTDAQRLAILQSLGCTVESDGTVKWTAQSNQ